MTSQHNFSRSLLMLTAITIGVLAIPLIAMQFTGEVNWTPGDFIAVGIFIFGSGFSYLLVTRKSLNVAYKSGFGILIGSSLFMIWSNLAVGITGNESEIFNLSYFGIVLVGMIGTFLSKFEAKKMMYTTFLMSGFVFVLMMTALLLNMQAVPGSSIMEILGVNAFFMFLFGLSGLAFKYASVSESRNQD